MRWLESEFQMLDLGDLRLNRRAVSILDRLGLAPGRTIPQSFKSRAEIKACYNFLDNDSVSEEKLLNPHIANTIERIREYPVVLLPSDTTEIDYTTKASMKGKERLSNKKNGIWLHPTIAVTPDRLMLGVVAANFWSRQEEVAEDNSAARTARDNAPIEEKESYRWLQSFETACEVARQAPDTQIIHMTDREGDIIEIYDAADEQDDEGPRAEFIIRSQHDRPLDEKSPETEKKLHTKLWQKLREGEALGEVEFAIPPTESRKGRKVKQQLKATSVIIKSKRKKLKVKVNAVMAIEINPPEGEKPLIWVFITSLPVDTFKDIKRIISYYLCRWEIEMFFKVLKSGCKIEERQLQTTDRMKALIGLFMVLSWRVMFTMMMGRVCSEMSCGELFEPAEWKAVCKILDKKKAVPRKPPSLGDFIKMVATLGGYVGGKNSDPPGVKTVWQGMIRMVDFALAWEAFRE